MKRSWVGFFLLLVLLGLGFLSSWAMEEVHDPISENLEEAAEQALQGQWARAAWFTADARRNWEKWKFLRTAFSAHGPSEDVDALFSALEVYGTTRQKEAFAGICREMAEKIQAIGEAHGLDWNNFLSSDIQQFIQVVQHPFFIPGP